MNKTAIQGPVRVRFAPSPTGFLHVGGARTAIYNELLRRSVGGAFVLRIEDTDRDRSDEAMVRQIQDGLSWVGVEWDEGPELQSAQVERHRQAVEQLLAKDRAYRCFCTPKTIAEQRTAAEKKGERFLYPRTCAHLPADESARRAEAGEPFVVRFRMPDEPVRFDDLVRGEVEFGPETFDDFILLRSDGSPTYHLSVCTDDVDMGITHVIRGEDHLSNTPKHVPLFKALDSEPPAFAHLPLILGANKKRLSKRTGATSVEEFRDQGMLPQALYNYLALLGWSPGDDLELMSREQMIELFTVERLNGSAAAFDAEKLAWMNAQYMSSLPFDEILRYLEPFLESVGLAGLEGEARARLEAAAELHRGRAKTLVELASFLPAYFVDRLDYDPTICAKYLGDDELPARLEELRSRYAGVETFDIDTLDSELRKLCEELDVKAGYLIHPLRQALSASKAGPPVFDLVAAMGRPMTDQRLGHFLEFLKATEAPEG